jgi:hypothetical protein
MATAEPSREVLMDGCYENKFDYCNTGQPVYINYYYNSKEKDNQHIFMESSFDDFVNSIGTREKALDAIKSIVHHVSNICDYTNLRFPSHYDYKLYVRYIKFFDDKYENLISKFIVIYRYSDGFGNRDFKLKYV